MQQHTQVVVAVQTSAMVYGDEKASEAIQEVARRAVPLYLAVMNSIGSGWSTWFVFGSRTFFESKAKPEPFNIEREKLEFRHAIDALIDVVTADVKYTPLVPGPWAKLLPERRPAEHPPEPLANARRVREGVRGRSPEC